MTSPNKKMQRWYMTDEGWNHKDQRVKEILFQIRAGRRFREIAQQFDITIARVSAIRRRAGIPRRIQPAT